MSPNKDETGRRIVSDAVVVDRAVKFIVYIRWHKTSQLVDDGRNKYWLKLIKRAWRVKSHIKLTMSKTLSCEDLPASIFRTLPTNGRFSTSYLSPLG